MLSRFTCLNVSTYLPTHTLHRRRQQNFLSCSSILFMCFDCTSRLLFQLSPTNPSLTICSLIILLPLFQILSPHLSNGVLSLDCLNHRRPNKKNATLLCSYCLVPSSMLLSNFIQVGSTFKTNMPLLQYLTY